MRILFVSTRSPYPLNGGHPLRTFHTLRQAARRHEVTLATFVRHPEEWDGLPVLRGFCRRVEALPLPTEMSLLARGSACARHFVTDDPLVVSRYRTEAMRRTLSRLLAEEHYDLLHLDILPLATYRSLAPALPTVLVDHNVEHELLERRVRIERGPAQLVWRNQARRLKRFEQSALRAATRVVAMSETDASKLRLLAPEARLHVVPNGVDLDFFRVPERPPAGGELVFVGALDFFPNADAMQWFCRDIWPRVRTRSPRARLTIVGAHPGAEVRALGALPGVYVAGQVPDVRPYVARAAACVVPLRVGSGTRLKILEAMAMGKAVVTTTVGCEGLEVTNGKDLLIGDTSAEFAEHVSTLLAQPLLAHALGAKAHTLVAERYSWDLVGRQQELVHASAVGLDAPSVIAG